MEECDISQLSGLGVSQLTLPVARSTPIKSARPPGASTASPESSSGHCPAHQSGTLVPYSSTKFFPHKYAPLVTATHSTWHCGPIETTQASSTAGIVREIP